MMSTFYIRTRSLNAIEADVDAVIEHWPDFARSFEPLLADDLPWHLGALRTRLRERIENFVETVTMLKAGPCEFYVPTEAQRDALRLAKTEEAKRQIADEVMKNPPEPETWPEYVARYARTLDAVQSALVFMMRVSSDGAIPKRVATRSIAHPETDVTMWRAAQAFRDDLREMLKGPGIDNVPSDTCVVVTQTEPGIYPFTLGAIVVEALEGGTSKLPAGAPTYRIETPGAALLVPYGASEFNAADGTTYRFDAYRRA